MKQRLLILACSVALLAACGTTKIYTNDPGARIYVDGVMVGKGSAEVRQRGAPGSSNIVVKTSDGRHYTQQMRRKFTTTTFAVGLITAYVGWVAAWEYPDSVYVQVEPREAARVVSWDGSDDAWLQPPPGWTPKTPAPPTPTAAASKGPDDVAEPAPTAPE